MLLKKRRVYIGIPVNLVRQLKNLQDQQLGVEEELLEILRGTILKSLNDAARFGLQDNRQGSQREFARKLQTPVMLLRGLRSKKKRLDSYIKQIETGLAQLRSGTRDPKNLKVADHLFDDEIRMFEDLKTFFDSVDTAASWMQAMSEAIKNDEFSKLGVANRQHRLKAVKLQLLGLIRMMEEAIRIGHDFEDSLRILKIGI